MMTVSTRRILRNCFKLKLIVGSAFIMSRHLQIGIDLIKVRVLKIVALLREGVTQRLHLIVIIFVAHSGDVALWVCKL